MRKQNITISMALLTAAVLFTACTAHKTASPASSDFVPPTLPSVRSSMVANARATANSEALAKEDPATVKSQISVAYRSGQIQRQFAASNDPGVAATVNGVTISKKAFDIEKATYAIAAPGDNESDRQILDGMIDEELLYEQAVKDGDAPTDSVVDSEITQEKEAMKNSPANAQTSAFMAGLGQASSQYWVDQKTPCKEALANQAYQTKLRTAFEKEHSNESDIQLDQDFHSYFNNLQSQYRAKAKITYYLS